jgi:hypothetical protein
MLFEPGANLDGEVTRRLGETGSEIPAYSTDPAASDRLVERLAQAGVFAEFERAGSFWYCTLSTDVGKVRERLATGTGSTRPAALCLAVLNLPGDRLRARPAPPRTAPG